MREQAYRGIESGGVESGGEHRSVRALGHERLPLDHPDGVAAEGEDALEDHAVERHPQAWTGVYDEGKINQTDRFAAWLKVGLEKAKK